MKTSDFYYDLPQELIAQTPLAQWDASRLMVLHKADGQLEHRCFADVIDYLEPGDCLVMNDSRVLPARLLGHRVPTGGAAEVLLLTDKGDGLWECLVKPGRKLHEGAEISFGDGILTATVEQEAENGNRLVRFHYEGIFLEILERLGKMPLPPYIERDNNKEDRERYQTVYCRHEGSVAAPTAGLHFTPRVLEALRAKGVELEEVTLHVGAGTFKPVKSEEIEGHEMHTEYISVHRHTLQRLIDHGGRAIAVGTTSVRTLESLYYMGLTLLRHPEATDEELHVKQWQPYEDAPSDACVSAVTALQALADYMDRHQLEALHSSTQIIIAPGYRYHIVKAIVTNFHQPQSTLLLLVSAFVRGQWHTIYDYALSHGFRFLSYGDSSILFGDEG